MKLREARTSRNLTQEQLEELSGVEQSMISALENGRVQSPSWVTVWRLAKALSMRPEELFPVSERAEVAS